MDTSGATNAPNASMPMKEAVAYLRGAANAQAIVDRFGMTKPAPIGGLHCTVCGGTDMAVVPAGVVSTYLICRSCGQGYEVPCFIPQGDPKQRGAGSGGGSSPKPPDEERCESGYVAVGGEVIDGDPEEFIYAAYDPLAGFSDDEVEDLHTRTFYRRIGEIMADNQFDRYVGNQRSGKIYNRALVKAAMGRDRVFQRRIERKNKHFKVYILADESHSMSNLVENTIADPANPGNLISEVVPSKLFRGNPMTRSEMMADAVRIAVKGFMRHGIDVAVQGFGGLLRKHKGFGPQKGFDVDRMHRNLATGYGGWNYDYQGVRMALDELRGSDAHNIVLVFADGGIGTSGNRINDPRTGYQHDACNGAIYPEGFTGDPDDGDADALLPAEFRGPCLGQAARDLSRVADIITIGIACEDVKLWYPNAHPVYTRREFMDTTLRELGHLITRE